MVPAVTNSLTQFTSLLLRVCPRIQIQLDLPRSALYLLYVDEVNERYNAAPQVAGGGGEELKPLKPISKSVFYILLGGKDTVDSKAVGSCCEDCLVGYNAICDLRSVVKDMGKCFIFGEVPPTKAHFGDTAGIFKLVEKMPTPHVRWSTFSTIIL